MKLSHSWTGRHYRTLISMLKLTIHNQHLLRHLQETSLMIQGKQYKMSRFFVHFTCIEGWFTSTAFLYYWISEESFQWLWRNDRISMSFNTVYLYINIPKNKILANAALKNYRNGKLCVIHYNMFLSIKYMTFYVTDLKFLCIIT